MLFRGFSPSSSLSVSFAFSRGRRTWTRDAGRAAIGPGLMLLSLHILVGHAGAGRGAPCRARAAAADHRRAHLSVLLVPPSLPGPHIRAWRSLILIMSLAYSHFVTPAPRWPSYSGPISAAPLTDLREVEAADPARSAPADRQPDQPHRRLRRGTPISHPISTLGAIELNPARPAADFQPVQRGDRGVFILPLDRMAALLTRMLPSARSADPRYTALSRRGALAHARRWPGMRGARNPAYGRHRREHAAPGHERPADQRPQARRKRSADGQIRSTAARSGEALCHRFYPREPRGTERPRAMEIISFSINLEQSATSSTRT